MSRHATEWQQRLNEHFASLSERVRRSGRQVFAIEHGLSLAELAELRATVKAIHTTHGVNKEHWLLWLVYATEHGYTSDGLQFWDGFGRGIPGWNHAYERPKIRAWFKQFEKEFCGVSPKGRWATHFSIISWPITHAILPRDLQRRFAQVLYETRFKLSKIVDRSASEIGRTLARASHDVSPRFRLFLEQEDLVGQIVIALLNRDGDTNDGVEAGAITRISHDISAMLDAKEWLATTQNVWAVASSEFKPKALLNKPESSLRQISESQRISHSLQLEASVSARECGPERWQLELTLPSFETIASKDVEYRRFLLGSRITIPSVSSNKFAGGWLLMGLRTRALQQWPHSGTPLFEFETPPPFNPEIDWEVFLPESKTFIFEIRSDAIGHLIRNNRLKPGGSYLILIPAGEQPFTIPGSKLCRTDCTECEIFRIDLPAQVSEELNVALQKYGLLCTQTISVSVAGIPPLHWDPDIGGVWAKGCPIFLSLTRNHDFDGYRLRIGNEIGGEFPVIGTEPVLIEISGLECGHHTVVLETFETQTINAGVQTKKTKASHQLSIEIRHADVWIAERANSPGMHVLYAPQNPSIEDFLSGEIFLEVQGSNGISCIFSLDLYDASGRKTESYDLGTVQLPVSNNAWQRIYQAFIKASNVNDYQTAHSSYLTVTSNECGAYRIDLTQGFSPLHWHLKTEKGSQRLFLIENYTDDAAVVSLSDFRFPLKKTPVDRSDVDQGITCAHPGGLFSATVADVSKEIILVPAGNHGELHGLALPTEPFTISGSREFSQLMDQAVMWKKARPLSFVARHWQRHLLRLFVDNVIEEFCGKRWLDEELSLRGQEQPALRQLEGLVVDSVPGLGIAIHKATIERSNEVVLLKQKVRELCGRYLREEINDEIFSVAWQLAWFDDTYVALSSEALELIRPHKKLVRASRLARLGSLHSTREAA